MTLAFGHRRRRRNHVFSGAGTALAAGALLMAAVAGCGGDDRPRPTPASGLPPATFVDLAPIFGPQVADLDLRLTRGALVDTQSRRPSPVGRHLALYVEPTDSWVAARYAETIVPLTRLLATTVFQRWPRLQSFDVCQEPPPGVDDRPEPAPVATVDLTRRASATFDWPTTDLVTLLAASVRRQPGVKLLVSPTLADDPTFQRSRAAAEAVAGPNE